MNFKIFIFIASLSCTTFMEKTKEKLAECYKKTKECGSCIYKNAVQVKDSQIAFFKEHISNVKEKMMNIGIKKYFNKMKNQVMNFKENILRKMERIGWKKEDEEVRIRREIMKLLEKFKTASDDEFITSEDSEVSEKHPEVGSKDEVDVEEEKEKMEEKHDL
ncbi:hypothetical protein DMUE_1886 [Dictyocoela muelleri]|nr:hypothetical protein DMUE_1886 [Dictyocoela muelleri]